LEITIQTEGIDYSKIEQVKKLIKRKSIVWPAFLLFGWSYGSFGKIGLQTIYYILPLFTISNLWINHENHQFDIYTGMAIMGAFVWVIWFFVRMFTLNHDIRVYNQRIADFYYLTPEEKQEVGLE